MLRVCVNVEQEVYVKDNIDKESDGYRNIVNGHMMKTWINTFYSGVFVWLFVKKLSFTVD